MEWQTLQRMQFEALDSFTPERLQGTKPSGWSVVTDSILYFRQRAGAARGADRLHQCSSLGVTY